MHFWQCGNKTFIVCYFSYYSLYLKKFYYGFN